MFFVCFFGQTDRNNLPEEIKKGGFTLGSDERGVAEDESERGILKQKKGADTF